MLLAVADGTALPGEYEEYALDLLEYLFEQPADAEDAEYGGDFAEDGEEEGDGGSRGDGRSAKAVREEAMAAEVAQLQVKLPVLLRPVHRCQLCSTAAPPRCQLVDRPTHHQ